MSEVIVLHAALPGHFGAALDADLMPRLAYARRLQLERCDAGTRRASLAAVDLLLQGAARLGFGPLDPAQICFPAGGKPYVEGGPRFSVSHSATCVAVAISSGCAVGIDVEDVVGPRTVAGSTPNPLERWTATEAALKAAGEGLQSVGRVLLAPDLATAQIGAVTVQLRVLSLGVGLVARLATVGEVSGLSVEEINPARPGLRPAAP